MPYLWEKNKNCTNRLIAEYDREESPSRFLFLEGTRIASDLVSKKIIFDHEVTQAEIAKYDCIPNNSGSPLVNQKVVDILLRLAPNEVQLFDADIKCKDGILKGYKLLNITCKIIGIDHEKSIYDKMQSVDAILGFRYLTYKSGCMGEHNLARDEEYLGNLLVTDEIKQAFEKEKITGVWFAKPEEWYSLANA